MSDTAVGQDPGSGVGSDDLRRTPPWDALRGSLSRGRRPELLLGVVVGIAVGLWMTRTAWGGRPLPGEDSMAHLIRADFAIDELLPRGRPDGWQPSFILGYQAFLFLGAGLSWAVAAVHWLSFGLLSTTGALKVVSLGAFVARPVAVAFLARSFGLDRRASGVAAILSLVVNNPFGVGLQAIFNVGLLSHELGAVFFFLALGGAVRLLRAPEARMAVFTAFCLSALFVTHDISLLVLVVLFGVIAVLFWLPATSVGGSGEGLRGIVRSEVRAQLRQLRLAPGDVEEEPSTVAARKPLLSRESVRHLFLAGTAAAGLSAFALLPLFGHRDLQGIFTGWSTPPLGTRLLQIWRGEILFPEPVPLLIVAGALWALLRGLRGDEYGLPLALGPLLYVVVAHIALSWWPTSVGVQQLDVRGLGYVGVLAVLPLGGLVASFSRRFDRLDMAGDLVAMGAAVAIVVLPSGPTRDLVKQMPEPVPAMRQAARELARRVPDGARFVTQRDFPQEITRTNLVNPDRWLAWASGRNTLNSFHVTSSQTPTAAYESEHLLDRTPDVVADALAREGVTHLVTVSDEAAARMKTSTRFTEVWRSTPLTIFSVAGRPGQPAPASLLGTLSPAQAQLVKFEPEHIEIAAQANTATVATVAVGWSPKWHAELDGRSVPLSKAQDGLLQLMLPAGSHRLTLDYRLDGWDYLGYLLTLATVVAGGRWLWRRRSSADGTPDEDVPEPVVAPETAPAVTPETAPAGARTPDPPEAGLPPPLGHAED